MSPNRQRLLELKASRGLRLDAGDLLSVPIGSQLTEHPLIAAIPPIWSRMTFWNEKLIPIQSHGEGETAMGMPGVDMGQDAP